MNIKKKIASISIAILFIAALAFNMQMANSNNQTNEVTLQNIAALTSSADESGGYSCYGNRLIRCRVYADHTIEFGQYAIY